MTNNKQWLNPSRGAPQHLKTHTLKRDNHTCQHCGDTGAEVDHINNTRGPHYNTPQNLQTLCTTCHQQKTRTEEAYGKLKRKQAGLMQKEQHPGIA